MQSIINGKHKVFLLLLLAGLFCCLDIAPCFAESGKSQIIGSFVTQLQTAIDNSESLNGLHEAAKKIFMALVVCQFVWSMWSLYFEGKATDLQAWSIAICRVFVVAAVGYAFLTSATTWIKESARAICGIVPSNYGSYAEISQLCLDFAGMPYKFLQDFIKQEQLKFLAFSTEAIYNCVCFIGATITTMLGAIAIVIPMVLACFTLIVAQCELQVSIAFAIFALGFAGSSWTRDIAVANIKHILACCVKVMVICFLINITKDMLYNITFFTTPTDWPDVFAINQACVFMAIIVYLLFKTLPQAISAPFGGSGGADGAGTAAFMAATYHNLISVARHLTSGSGSNSKGGQKNNPGQGNQIGGTKNNSHTSTSTPPAVPPPSQSAGNTTVNGGNNNGQVPPPSQSAGNTTVNGGNNNGQVPPPSQSAGNTTVNGGNSNGQVPSPSPTAGNTTINGGNSNGQVPPPSQSVGNTTINGGNSNGHVPPPKTP